MWNLIKRGTANTNYQSKILHKNISFKDLSNLLKQLAQSHDIVNEYYVQEIKKQTIPCNMQMVDVKKGKVVLGHLV